MGQEIDDLTPLMAPAEFGPLAIRPMGPPDRAYVCSTWTQSYLYRYPARLRRRLREKHIRTMHAILDGGSGGGGAQIVCSTTAPAVIHGWVCSTGVETIDYVYVPVDLRRRGLARAAITHALGGRYPDRVYTRYGWPWPSARFVGIVGIGDRVDDQGSQWA